MSEADRYFSGLSEPHRTLERIARRLDELGIPYAVVGAMAMFQHGYRRFTEDVDLLVTADGLRRAHESLEGLGYVALFRGSRSLRDVENGVKIEFLIAGAYPGDGKPKPVAFPHPQEISVAHEGLRVISLPVLIQLKLASGMSEPSRLKDLSDVLELIKALALPASLAASLDPSVRAKYDELWRQAQRRFLLRYRPLSDAPHARILDDLIAALGDGDGTLAAMKAAGITIDDAANHSDGWVYLATDDPTVARRFGLYDASEF